MATVKMMQGDSFAIFVDLRMEQTGDPIVPSMVSDVEICVGTALRKTYSDREVHYDETQLQWYFVPSQEETFAMDPGSYEVQTRIKFPNGQYSSVRGVIVGTIQIYDAISEAVI